MSHASTADGSEDVNDFLLRIRELGDKRDKEDEERTRKLEEEILQGRKERQARRAERARSISPTKETPKSASSATPPSSTKQLDLDMAAKRTAAIDPPVDLHPSRSPESNRIDSSPTTSRRAENIETPGFPGQPLPPSPTRSTAASKPSPASATSLARAGTLSWQQRPTSRGSNGSRSRPPSALGDRSSKPPDRSPDSPSTSEAEPTRDQIAQSLASRDASWFRQTADRGLGSAAYRRNAEDTMSDTASNTGSMRLPGMSRESTTEPEKSTRGGSLERSPSRASSVQGSNTWSNRFSSQSSYTTAGGLGSPMPLSSAQRLEPRLTESVSVSEEINNDRVAMSPAQGRIAPERSPSPTKGLGGFVQSAMMKRSDSVNKRWSTQAPTGLSRGDSIASNRSGYGGSINPPYGSTSPPRDTRPLSMGREPSPLTGSRPGSSHSGVTVTPSLKENERPGTSGTMSSRAESIANDGFVKPPLPLSISRPNRTPDSDSPKSPEKLEVVPVSPSKTMDPKRWSPTKSSWLESAINKPTESPKPKPQTSQQPSWMNDLSKSKSQKSSIDLGRTGTHKEVATIGLLRSPPMGGLTKSPNIGGLPEGFSSGLVKKNSSVSPTRSKAAISPVDGPSDDELKESAPEKDIALPKKDSDVPVTPPIGPDPHVSTPKSTTSSAAFTPRHDRSSPTPVLKPKPATPPKLDFRANLKSRQLPKDDASNREPEFKNAIGKLKRTQTKNYVAPDELKDNILRGKAGLAITSGPKRTQRVDEFKDSILKRKEEMKTGGGTVLKRQPSTGTTAEEDKAPPIPEAIAKRSNLTRSNSNLSSEDGLREQQSRTPNKIQEPVKVPGESPLRKASDEVKSKPAVGPKFSPKSQVSSRADPPRQTDSKDIPKSGLESSLGRRFGASTPDLATNPDPKSDLPSPSQSGEASPSDRFQTPLTKSVSTPTTSSRETPGSKLAGRLNPALAGILSRGPPPASDRVGSDTTLPPQPTQSTTSTELEDGSSGKGLTHMTKARAKGPKRRLPKGQVASSPSPDLPAAEEAKKPAPSTSVQPEPLPSTTPSKPASIAQRSPEVTRQEISDTEFADLADLYPPKNPLIKKRSMFDLDSKNPAETGSPKPKPPVSAKSPLVQRVISPPSQVTKPTMSPTAGERGSPQRERFPIKIDGSKSSATAAIPAKPELAPEKTELEEDSAPSFSSTASRWGKSSEPLHSRALPIRPDKPTVTEIERQVPNQVDEDIPIGLGLRSVSINSRGKDPNPVDRSLPTLPSKPQSPPIAQWPDGRTTPKPPQSKKEPAVTAKSPPVPSKSRIASTPKVTHRIKPSINSPIPRTSDARRVILEFFSETPSSKGKIDFDTQRVLSSKSEATSKITTIRKSIFEINGDGKKIDMPSHQEHILYEESMYLLVHNFQSANNTKANEVMLWCGDGVGEAAVEDAQLFCRKVARENSAKLTVVKQGKEPSNFIQALGGILVTRRGASGRASSMYMLCCRQHIGQVVFDEVDLSPKKLCSAFPYIVSAKFGKLLLWKGKGSTAEELGCARLIGMDLGLTGEFDECAEEEEPLSFFESFPDITDHSIPKSSQNWVQKPNHPKFGCRLFRIDQEVRQQSGMSFWSRRGSPPPEAGPAIAEISPFSQSDLVPSNIYVLDAFFEIYVIVGKAAQSKSSEFVTAVHFAQEYGILAASLQDRPFIPYSSVVFGGLPKDAAAVFRKWKDDSKGDELIAVELNAAVEAVMSG